MTTPRPSVVAAGARLRRDDGHVLLVRARSGVAAGRWSLPIAAVADDEVAEEAATRLLRDALHLDPGRLEFAETLAIAAAAEDVLVNVFDALGWTGEPRYSARDFDDAGWLDPAALDGVDLVPEVAAWLAGGERAAPSVVDRGALALLLVEARRELLAAYDAIPPLARERPLDGEWAPVDVLHHAAAVEAYYFDETVRLVEVPGHRWRPFNEAQAEADRRVRPRPADGEVRDRIDRVQSETLHRLQWLTPEQLAGFGAHPTRGVVLIRDQIERIATHDRAHADQLRAMQHTALRGER